MVVYLIIGPHKSFHIIYRDSAEKLTWFLVSMPRVVMKIDEQVAQGM